MTHIDERHAKIYRSLAEELSDLNRPEPNLPPPHAALLPRIGISDDELRDELARREAERQRQQRESERQAAERLRKDRELDAISADALATHNATVKAIRAILPFGALAAQLERAEQNALRRAYEVDGQAGDGAMRHRLDAHPVQRLRSLLDMLRDDQPENPSAG